ncbi:MAG: pyridoxamine 5'-phosphate oxidase family protein [Actinobacteria bacterium]|nr:pyridoxamine 5'-phosphate oxidase family protein [Actinomycetota bacterium]
MTDEKREIKRKPHRSVAEIEEIYSILDEGMVASRMFMALKSGVQICATVTLLDGIVSARSPFNSSMNYRSVMAFGVPKVLEGDEKEKALYAVSERLIPGLWDAGREQTKKEFAQTMMVELKLDDVTAKKRTGEALDGEEDLQLPIWAGYIPINSGYGEPVTNENAKHLPVPDYIKNLANKNLMRRKAE